MQAGKERASTNLEDGCGGWRMGTLSLHIVFFFSSAAKFPEALLLPRGVIPEVPTPPPYTRSAAAAFLRQLFPSTAASLAAPIPPPPAPLLPPPPLPSLVATAAEQALADIASAEVALARGTADAAAAAAAATTLAGYGEEETPADADAPMTPDDSEAMPLLLGPDAACAVATAEAEAPFDDALFAASAYSPPSPPPVAAQPVSPPTSHEKSAGSDGAACPPSPRRSAAATRATRLRLAAVLRLGAPLSPAPPPPLDAAVALASIAVPGGAGSSRPPSPTTLQMAQAPCVADDTNPREGTTEADECGAEPWDGLTADPTAPEAASPPGLPGSASKLTTVAPLSLVAPASTASMARPKLLVARKKQPPPSESAAPRLSAKGRAKHVVGAWEPPPPRDPADNPTPRRLLPLPPPPGLVPLLMASGTRRCGVNLCAGDTPAVGPPINVGLLVGHPLCAAALLRRPLRNAWGLLTAAASLAGLAATSTPTTTTPSANGSPGVCESTSTSPPSPLQGPAATPTPSAADLLGRCAPAAALRISVLVIALATLRRGALLWRRIGTHAAALSASVINGGSNGCCNSNKTIEATATEMPLACALLDAWPRSQPLSTAASPRVASTARARPVPPLESEGALVYGGALWAPCLAALSADWLRIEMWEIGAGRAPRKVRIATYIPPLYPCK